jgi:AcrR family transcriptional regulator
MADMPPALARSSVDRGQISQEVRSAERRERVLEMMIGVFAKRGYQAATVDHLIAGGKISMGGFYQEFEGKEDCFLAVYDRVIANVRERLAAAVPEGSDWPTTLVLGMRTVVEIASEKPLAARVVLLEAQTGGELAVGRYTATLETLAGILRQGREETEKAGDLPPSFEDATVSGLTWLLQSRLSRERIEDPADLWARMAKMALEPYLGASRAEQTLRRIPNLPGPPLPTPISAP